MSRWLRLALLYIEGLSTAAVGLVTVFAPALMLSKITDLPSAPAGLAVARQLGTAWVVIGLLQCLLPRIHAPRTLRMFLVPIFIGDVLHSIALWPWGTFALAHLIPTAVYVVNRGSIVLWPESFIGRNATETPVPPK